MSKTNYTEQKSIMNIIPNSLKKQAINDEKVPYLNTFLSKLNLTLQPSWICSYIQKGEMSKDFAFQSKKICGKSA